MPRGLDPLANDADEVEEDKCLVTIPFEAPDLNLIDMASEGLVTSEPGDGGLPLVNQAIANLEAVFPGRFGPRNARDEQGQADDD